MKVNFYPLNEVCTRTVSKLERCPELTQDVPREEETGHTQKGIFILAENRVLDTTHGGAIDV